jgi:hypothetical protein
MRRFLLEGVNVKSGNGGAQLNKFDTQKVERRDSNETEI